MFYKSYSVINGLDSLTNELFLTFPFTKFWDSFLIYGLVACLRNDVNLTLASSCCLFLILYGLFCWIS
jgi:hypothetical protein